MSGRTLGLVCAAASGIEHVRERLIEPMLEDGWTIAVTLTPTATTWLETTAEIGKIEAITGLPVRSTPRLPHRTSPHPTVDCYAAVPAIANLVAKLALGIADNQALTQLCEAIGGRRPPVVVFMRERSSCGPTRLGTPPRGTRRRWCPPHLRRGCLAAPRTAERT
jgi:hypothetical protein